MAIYLISYPDGRKVSAKGVAIETKTTEILIPPATPAYFRLFATNRDGSFYSPGIAIMLSYSVPWIQTLPRGNGYCYFYLHGTNQFGQSYSVGDVFGDYICGSAFFTPGNTKSSRCDVLITNSNGSLTTLTGVNGQSCPTWTTTPDGECADSEIKCDCPSDPRGFICISCDQLNNKIRALI